MVPLAGTRPLPPLLNRRNVVVPLAGTRPLAVRVQVIPLREFCLRDRYRAPLQNAFVECREELYIGIGLGHIL